MSARVTASPASFIKLNCGGQLKLVDSIQDQSRQPCIRVFVEHTAAFLIDNAEQTMIVEQLFEGRGFQFSFL